MIGRNSLAGAARFGLLLTLVYVVGAGCLGRSPRVEHFMLGTSGAEGSVSAPVSDLALLVGPVRLPAYLERPQIASLETGGRVELDEFNRWLGGFEENFLRSLSLGLARRLGSIKVTTHPSSAPFPATYQVRLHVDDLVFVGAADALRARIRWALIRKGGEASPELFLLEEDFPVADDSPVGLVQAHEAAMEELVSRIAAEIVNLAASPEEADG